MWVWEGAWGDGDGPVLRTGWLYEKTVRAAREGCAVALVKGGDEGSYGLYRLPCQYRTRWPCSFALTWCVAVLLATFSEDYAAPDDEALGRRTHSPQPIEQAVVEVQAHLCKCCGAPYSKLQSALKVF